MAETPNLITHPIFATADSAEALCLYTAGIALHPQQQAENLYTTDWLARNGFASVQDAIRSKRHGLRSWFFVASERQRKLSQLFHSKRDALKAAADPERVDLKRLKEEDFASICCLFHMNRQFLENLWKSVPPKKGIPDGKGGWNFIGADASKADKRHLGIS